MSYCSQQDPDFQKELNRLREVYKNRTPAPEKGHVEMFMVHDERYYAIYLDGEIFENTADKYARINTFPMSRSWRRSLARVAGVEEGDLRFSYSCPYIRANELDLEIEDLTYEMIVVWRGEFPTPSDFHAIGLAKLEEMIMDGEF